MTQDRTFSISLEFGHTTLAPDGSLDHDELRRSCVASDELKRDLEVNDVDVDICSVLLIDDKKIAPDTRTKLGDRLIAYLKEFTGIDYYCYERDLAAYVEPMLACLTKRVRKTQEKSIKRRFAAGFDTLSCPVDIAIWHLLRLGVLKDDVGIMQPLDASESYRSTDLVISVLPDYLHVSEYRAMSRILKHIQEYPTVCERIKPVYFPHSKTYSIPSVSGDVNHDLSHATSPRSLARLVATLCTNG